MDVVLIHLGGRAPAYLRDAVEQATGVCGRPPVVVGPREGRRARGTRLDRFRARERMTEMGLGGFWRYSAERLFVLEEALRARGIGRCVHIESDNLLYVPPAEYEGWLGERHGDGIATCPLTEHEDTAAVMYVGSIRALEAYNQALLELVELGEQELLDRHGGTMANEMRMLRVLRDAGRAGALPTTVARAAETGSSVVFDPASYGQHVDGIPGSPGVPYAGGHHEVGREILAGDTSVSWDAQRRAPLATRYGVTFPLANLHVHSKRLRRLVTEWSPPSPPAAPGLAGRVKAQLRDQALRLRHRRRSG